MHPEAKLNLRPATLADAMLLCAWRNDQETRNHSRNTAEVTWTEHFAWFTQSLGGATPTRTLYIAEDSHGPIGTIRADKGEEGIELSWTVAPKARGHGYGKVMVLQFVSEVFPNEKLIARIEEGHTSSEKIAAALGLHKAEAELSEGDARVFFIWR